MAKSAASKKEKLRRDAERTIERAEEFQLSIDQTLRESRQRMKRIRANLRRAGLLRD
jgi:hypothetical protein